MPRSSSRTPRSVRWPPTSRRTRSDVAADRWRGDRAAAMEGCDRGRRRAAGADAGPDAGTGAGARLRVDRLDDSPRMAVHSARRRRCSRDGRVLFAGGCSTAAELYDPATGTFTPTGDMTAVRGGVGRDAAPRRPRAVHRRVQLRAGRPGWHLGIGRAVRPGDRDLQPDRLDGHPARVPDRDTVGGRSRPHRRRVHGPQARARAPGSPSPRIDSWSRRPACSRPPSCTTRRPARSAGPVR